MESNERNQRQRRFIILPLSAGLSGIVEAMTTHPIDRVKTEMQRLTLDKTDASFRSALRSIFQSGGLTGFYSGIVPRLIGVVPMRLMYWGTLNNMNDITSSSSNRFVQYVVPGIVAGAVQSIVDNPIEVLKTKLMTGATNVQWRTLYDGFVPLISRNIVFAIHVGCFTKLWGQDQPFLAGAFGGMIGSIVSQPFDVIKTEMQRHHQTHSSAGFTEIFRTVYKQGWQKLFAGTMMRCTLGFANMGIGFMVLKHIQIKITKIFETQ
jgi:solute carrier family 25 (mitochondrial 2-oxodicarboxylate transporter), member 21